jgi:MFS family permease
MDDSAGRIAPAAARWMLLLLILANVLSVGDRMLLSVTTEPIRQELALSDRQIAVVNGLLFVVFHLVAGLFVARLIDRGNRMRLLSMGIAGWSIAAAATGIADDFASLSLARIGLGVGEATVFPAAMSLLPDLFARQTRGRAIACFQTSGFLGVMGGASLAGLLAAAYGWRAMFVLFGVAGVAFSLVIHFSASEPRREAQIGKPLAAAPYPADLASAGRRVLNVPGFLCLALSFGFAGMVVAVVAAWGPAVLQRSHSLSLAQVGLVIGVASGVGGILGTLLAGVLVDRLQASGALCRMLTVPAVALPVSIPLLLGFALAPSLAATVFCAVALSFVLGCAVAPCVTYAVCCVEPGDRGVAGFLMLASAGLIGSSLGPLVAAEVSDQLAASLGSESLRYAIASLTLAPLLATGLLQLARRQSQGSARTGAPAAQRL